MSSSSNFKALLDAQILKLQSEAHQVAASERDSDFRQQLDKDRKIVSSKRSYENMQAIPGGLAPAVAMLMHQNSFEELEAGMDDTKPKKRKRHKKEKSEKKHKKNSSKKHKKDKSKKKRRTKDESGDDSSQSSSDSKSTASSR